MVESHEFARDRDLAVLRRDVQRRHARLVLAHVEIEHRVRAHQRVHHGLVPVARRPEPLALHAPFQLAGAAVALVRVRCRIARVSVVDWLAHVR